MSVEPAYRTAFLDWLACAVRGAREPVARVAFAAGDGTGERVAAAGTAGHALDFDDTYAAGLSHLSAPVAPVALVLAAETGAGSERLLDAYAAGFEAMGALARASHPALYENGWHPTAVCGRAGAAVAAARLLGRDDHTERVAVALALQGAAGTRAGFGNQGKALGVGLAAAAGLSAARLAAAGAEADLDAAATAFAATTGGAYAEPDGETPAIAENWIKAYPCCLQTHGAIECAAGLDHSGEAELTVAVHPVSLQAAAIEDPQTGLEAKFSIPYLTAFALLHGPPSVDDFAGIDTQAAELARSRVRVETRADVGQSETIIEAGGERVARVEAALGSPARPFDDEDLRRKVEGLAGPGLEERLDDPRLALQALREGSAA